MFTLAILQIMFIHGLTNMAPSKVETYPADTLISFGRSFTSVLSSATIKATPLTAMPTSLQNAHTLDSDGR